MHVGIIMDGNRRFAQKEKLFPRFKGHLYGKLALERLLKHWVKMGKPKYLTLYAFSLNNLKKRSTIEKRFIFKLLEIGFKELLNSQDIFKNKVKILFVGKKEKCPKSLQNLMKDIEQKTKNHKNKFLTFCVCYDGQEEIVNSFNNMIKKGVKKADLKTIKKYLYTKDLPQVDLMIRTGDEKRISGFLLWDISYAELIFRKETWPEYTPKMFEDDLKEYEKRKRRFGK
ncbi:MAG: di-trans,poly-cis-decaprenylcistransferase [Nanoarchaeota archaeon]|nr:di-trans,poly-cis-decaprenylcistransferase [Nanoarchaeota archaeon]